LGAIVIDEIEKEFMTASQLFQIPMQYCSTTRKCKWKSTKGSIKHSHLFTCNEDPSCQGHLAHDILHVHITQTQHAKDMAW